jgi:hypothetical protein
VGYAYCGTGEFVSGVEDWVLGVDDGLGVEDDGCTWTGGGCGVLKEVLRGLCRLQGFCWEYWSLVWLFVCECV